MSPADLMLWPALALLIVGVLVGTVATAWPGVPLWLEQWRTWRRLRRQDRERQARKAADQEAFNRVLVCVSCNRLSVLCGEAPCEFRRTRRGALH